MLVVPLLLPLLHQRPWRQLCRRLGPRGMPCAAQRNLLTKRWPRWSWTRSIGWISILCAGGCLRMRVLASKSKERDQSDPHVAELSTQQQKTKYVREICWTYFEKNKLRIGSNIFRNLFFHLQFTQMIVRQYKRYIQQFRRKNMLAVSTGLRPCFLVGY